MRILLVFFCVCFSLNFLIAEIPTVPNKIEFAGLNLKLSDRARKKIQAEVDALTRNPKYFQIKVDRLQIYFPIIERIFTEEGLPEDFKYLVLQESALISDAVSSSNAVGFWQFKTAAATEVGLRVDRNVDERLNIVSSTRGAAKYIKKNNRLFFDNWVHALLAYQQGPGGAQKLVNRKYQGSNSMTIDSRTHWYVIKFLAHKIAFEQVKSTPPQLYLIEYYEGQGKSLKEISNQKNLDVELVQKYNKWLKRGRVPRDKPYAVILPYHGNTGVLLASRSSEPAQTGTTRPTASVEYETHPTKYPVIKPYRNRRKGIRVNGIKAVRIRQDMDLNTLSNSTGVSEKRLRYYNDLTSRRNAKKGELWYLKPKRSKAGEGYHIVQTGEDLWIISQKYGIKLKQLRKKNRIPRNQTTVKPGRVLWLIETRPSGTKAAFVKPDKAAETENKQLPESKANDIPETTGINTMSAGSGETDLHGSGKKGVNPHETLTPTPPDEPENLTKIPQMVHEVQAGETLYGISIKYGVTVEDLRSWNDLDQSNSLSIGQQLKISGDQAEHNEQTTPTGASNASYEIHKVQAGETLYQIARQYQVTIKQLMELNQKQDFKLGIGEELKVPVEP